VKKGIAAVGVILLLVAAGATWHVHRLKRGPEPRSGEVAISGLQAPVEILIDSLGVPHVWAQTSEDLFFAQGFLHASDRLWQMELFRRLPWGRLSEVMGPAALGADRFMRTLGMGRAADRSLDAAASVRRELDAYAAGVNAAVRHWRGPLPPEFAVLRFEPGEWTPANTIAMEKIMAWDLAQYHTGLNLAVAREVVSDEAWDLIRPGYPRWGATILEGVGADTPGPRGEMDASASDPGDAARRVANLSPGLLDAARLDAPTLDLLDMASTVHASNSWVVGGDRSASGKPLLANDMHLGLDQPNIWYLMGLHGPDMDVVGMTLPGAPGVVAGHSAAVAWGFTNAMLDDADLFVERVDPTDSTRYLTPDGSRPFTTRAELIPIRGGGEDTLIVRETRHGPVMTPVEPRSGGQVLALGWVALNAESTAPALLTMNRARSVAGFLDGLAGFTNAHQNVVFADTAGAWGYWMGGRLPIRAQGRPATLPVPGWSGEFDWTGWVPFAQHPHVLEPDRGFVATANNRQGWDSVSTSVSETWAPPYRAQRISQVLAASDRHDAASMTRLQMDVVSDFAVRYRAKAADAFRSAGLVEAADRLAAWSGDATAASIEATLFYAWIEEVRRSLRMSAYGEDRGYMPNRAVARALEAPLGPPEAAAAATRAWQGGGDLPWGDAHQLSLGHPLSGIPVLGPVLGFGKGPLPREGGPHTVNVAGYSGEEPPFRVTSGPSQRHVVDLADPDGSGGFILPGGQSGLPNSPHSWDQLERWRRGELWLLPLDRSRVEARTTSRFTLTPER
jgi:penicillin amidase